MLEGSLSSCKRLAHRGSHRDEVSSVMGSIQWKDPARQFQEYYRTWTDSAQIPGGNARENVRAEGITAKSKLWQMR
jgi:hypothetical protein